VLSDVHDSEEMLPVATCAHRRQSQLADKNNCAAAAFRLNQSKKTTA